MSGEEANVKGWGCPVCADDGKVSGQVHFAADGSHTYEKLPCPTCAAHFKAVREAVEDFRRRAVGELESAGKDDGMYGDGIDDRVDVVRKFAAEAIRSLPIGGDQ